MNRYEFALAASVNSTLSTLPVLARELVKAIDGAQAEGATPEDDPAVLVIGAFIAFHTHADVNSVRGYRNLLALCEERVANQDIEQ